MSDSPRVAFVAGQLALLQPFDLLVLSLPARPFAALQLAADEAGVVTATLAPRPTTLALGPDAQAAAHRLGFVDTGGTLARAGAIDQVVDAPLVEAVLTDVFGAGVDELLDVHHGSRRAEHEAELKVAELRRRIQPLLAEMLGREPTVDQDGDFVFDWAGEQVYVSPKPTVGGPVVVRIFAITNVGVRITPELGLFIARLNFGLVFGRFALDVEHDAVWFMETLLGDVVADDELRFGVGMVAATASQWDAQIAQLFGGFTRADAEAANAAEQHQPKPGAGGYI